MKKLFVLLAVALFLGACGSSESKSEVKSADAAPEISMENMVELSIPVAGMTCEGCENAVKKSIGSLEGIAEVTASHIDSMAVVKYDATQTSPEEIKEKIGEAGYTIL